MDCINAHDHGSLGPPIQSAPLRWRGCWSWLLGAKKKQMDGYICWSKCDSMAVFLPLLPAHATYTHLKGPRQGNRRARSSSGL
jgi:hypothetical protein